MRNSLYAATNNLTKINLLSSDKIFNHERSFQHLLMKTTTIQLLP